MNDFLDWFRLEEAFSIIALACILTFVGGQMTRRESETYRRARRITAAVFLLYAGAGMYFWGFADPTELVLIAMRAALAAGTAFGAALVTLSPVAFLIERVRASIPKQRPMPVEAPKPQSPHPAPIRDHAPEERTEKERMNKIDDARTIAEQFYAEHAEFLAEPLPQALFATQMKTRFPADISPDQAWNATQGLITEMVPLIKAGREKKRAEQEEERKRVEQASEDARKLKETEERGSAFQKLAEWLLREQEIIKQSLPEGQDRDDALHQLFERYDQLMKETYAEMKP